jgi:hypothetical protein
MKTSSATQESARQRQIEHVDENADSEWRDLYIIAATAALIAVALFLIEIVGFSIWRQPTTVIGYFTLFQNNKLLGLFDFYLLDFLAFVFLIPVYLALYFALRRTSRSWLLIATAVGFVGNTVYLVSNTAFCMLSLSGQYSAANTESQKAIYLAAGQVMLKLFNVTGLYVSYVFFSVWGVIISFVMLRSKIFSKTTGRVGIVANAVALASIALAFESVASGALMAVSFIFLEVWLIMTAQTLLCEAHLKSESSAAKAFLGEIS